MITGSIINGSVNILKGCAAVRVSDRHWMGYNKYGACGKCRTDPKKALADADADLKNRRKYPKKQGK